MRQWNIFHSKCWMLKVFEILTFLDKCRLMTDTPSPRDADASKNVHFLLLSSENLSYRSVQGVVVILPYWLSFCGNWWDWKQTDPTQQMTDEQNSPKIKNAICMLPFKILQSVSTVTRDTFFAVEFLVEAAKYFEANFSY